MTFKEIAMGRWKLEFHVPFQRKVPLQSKQEVYSVEVPGIDYHALNTIFVFVYLYCIKA
jgi:hypothetical protein